VKKIKPIGFKRPVKIKISDNYFRFWFSYTYRLMSLLESQLIDDAISYIVDTLDNYISHVFEDIIAELVPILFKANIIRTRPIQIGTWWHKDQEIDVIVRDPGTSTTFMEVKWRDLKLKDARSILRELEFKASKSGLVSPVNYYILFSREIIDCNTPLNIDNHRIIVDLKTLSAILKTRQ